MDSESFEAGKRAGKLEEHSTQIRVLFQNQKDHEDRFERNELRLGRLEGVYSKFVGGTVVIGIIYMIIGVWPVIQQLLITAVENGGGR